MSIKLVGFDGDDTLWRSEDYYRDAQARFEQMLANYVDVDDVHERLYAIESRNLALFGYGVKGMSLSMLEAAYEISGGRVSAEDLHRIVLQAKQMLRHPVELIPGIREAVAEIAADFPVVLVTKGDLFHQEAKTRGGYRDAILDKSLNYKDSRRYRGRKKSAKCGPMWSRVRSNRLCFATVTVAA